MPRDIEDLVAVVETWQGMRIPLATKGANGGFTSDGLYEFIQAHSDRARQLISLTQKKDPEFWSAWIELGQQASTIVAGGKIVADHIDRSNL
jgi:hypothetical protein